MKRDFSKWEVLCAAPLVKDREGLKLEAYICPAGVPTIGYGHTKGVVLGTRITKEQADQMLTLDLERFKAQVAKCVKVQVTKGQFIALMDFVYNLGAGALRESTLLKLLNQGDYYGAAEQFKRWIYITKTNAEGQSVKERMKGLIERRALERKYFLEELM